jgi:hypothetical protein
MGMDIGALGAGLRGCVLAEVRRDSASVRTLSCDDLERLAAAAAAGDAEQEPVAGRGTGRPWPYRPCRVRGVDCSRVTIAGCAPSLTYGPARTMPTYALLASIWRVVECDQPCARPMAAKGTPAARWLNASRTIAASVSSTSRRPSGRLLYPNGARPLGIPRAIAFRRVTSQSSARRFRSH